MDNILLQVRPDNISSMPVVCQCMILQAELWKIFLCKDSSGYVTSLKYANFFFNIWSYLIAFSGLDELRDFPEYFSCSMENRIKPRHELCEQMGLRLSLHAMFRPGNVKFKSLLRSHVGASLPVWGSPLWNAGVNWSIDNRV
jgi:mTERF